MHTCSLLPLCLFLSSLFVPFIHTLGGGGLRPRQEDNIQPVQLHALLVSFEAAEITAAAAQAFYQWPYTCRTGGRLANVSAERPATALTRRCCALGVLCHCLHVLALQLKKTLQQSALYRQDVSGEISRAILPAATKPGETWM